MKCKELAEQGWGCKLRVNKSSLFLFLFKFNFISSIFHFLIMVALSLYCLCLDIDEILLTSSSSPQTPRGINVTKKCNVQTTVRFQGPLDVQGPTFSKLSTQEPRQQGRLYQTDSTSLFANHPWKHCIAHPIHSPTPSFPLPSIPSLQLHSTVTARLLCSEAITEAGHVKMSLTHVPSR